MRILHLRSPKGIFGAENFIISLAKKQQESGDKVFVAILNDCSNNKNTELLKKIKESGLCLIYLECKRFDVRIISKIRKIIIKEKIDIIHSHGYKSNFYSFFSSLWLKSVLRIATCHTWYSDNIKMKFYEFLDKILLKKFYRIVCVAPELVEEVKKNGIPEEKVSFILNGVDIFQNEMTKEASLVRKSLNLASEDYVIGTIARLSKGKGHVHLINILPKLLKDFPNIKYLIVGDGVLREDLSKEAKGLGVQDKIIFAGTRNDIIDILSELNLFVLPSLKEGLPIALLEAMAGKKTIVVSDVGAINMVIKDDYNGKLVIPGDEESLEKAIRQLLKNKQKATYLAENAFKDVVANFSSSAMKKKYDKVYRGENAN